MMKKMAIISDVVDGVERNYVSDCENPDVQAFNKYEHRRSTLTHTPRQVNVTQNIAALSPLSLSLSLL